MSFKTDSSSDREAMSEINVTPLVDVMLVLLVVFIVTAPLLTQAVHVDLPKTEKTDPAPDKHLATISIDAQGNLTVNEKPQVLAALEQQLRDLHSADAELTVQFQADTAVPYGKVAEAMAVAHKAGINKLAFITKE
ncbi:ExbD/TolR family protein [Methylovulum psychrotolerans]|jgi:biopolymer transport protein ExbD|uniref:Biopolymer transporter ExbD n=1 Tax=Methylovulum psychrotolerans TaxID=1704499 RepID=A0A1Z4C2G9_9GAMM|nr:biopolymer transporter ExbD [Methylovulum psychrotolerans]ASF47709.1 biopolymer transporter ExbD [Methylovulum psychrotolerans]MBT9096322.1 biopolymer transporter ExbD [Methylovulum psychrotolerans]POZ52445.1 biopolymer transporter ExbD [Methylovulum psychrotolerans]